MKTLVMLQPERPHHGDEEQLERYALGTLANEQASRLEEHLLTCEDCRRELAQVEAYVASVQQAGRGLRTEEWVPRHWWELPRLVPILAAAVIVLSFAAGWFEKNSAPPLAVRLMTVRGAAGVAQAPADRPLRLQPDIEGLTIFASERMEISSETGHIVWRGPLLGATVPGMRPGLYFVRVRRASGELLREYVLEVASR